MSNAHLFRRLARAEESMMRASMPRVSADDPTPLTRSSRSVVASVGGTRLVYADRPNGFTLAEVAH